MFVEDIFSSPQDFVPSFLENLTDDELKKEAKNEAKNDALSSIIKVFSLKFVLLFIHELLECACDSMDASSCSHKFPFIN